MCETSLDLSNRIVKAGRVIHKNPTASFKIYHEQGLKQARQVLNDKSTHLPKLKILALKDSKKAQDNLVRRNHRSEHRATTGVGLMNKILTTIKNKQRLELTGLNILSIIGREHFREFYFKVNMDQWKTKILGWKTGCGKRRPKGSEVLAQANVASIAAI